MTNFMEHFCVTSSIAKHNTKIKFFPNGKIHITCFSRDIFNDGWEDIREKDIVCREAYELNNPRDDSLKRAKGKIFDIALSNEWDYMITLTLDKDKIDRYDKEAIIKPFRKWLNNMVSRYGLKYLIVPEYHSDGAIHFHGLINESLNLTNSGTYKIPQLKKPCKEATVKKYGYSVTDAEVRAVYNINNWHFGFSTAIKIDENVEAVSKYITKYTCKNFQKIFGQTFFAGGGVNRELPNVMLNIPYNRLDVTEYKLPENLGGVKYLILDKSELLPVLNSMGVTADFDFKKYEVTTGE